MQDLSNIASTAGKVEDVAMPENQLIIKAGINTMNEDESQAAPGNEPNDVTKLSKAERKKYTEATFTAVGALHYPLLCPRILCASKAERMVLRFPTTLLLNESIFHRSSTVGAPSPIPSIQEDLHSVCLALVLTHASVLQS